MLAREPWENIVTFKNHLLYFCSFLALILITLVYAHKILIASNNLFSTDFFKFYQSARFYFQGQDIYDKILRPLTAAQAAVLHSKNLILPSDLNPPFFSLILLPAAWLSYGTALILWSALSFTATILGILLALKSYPTLWQHKIIRNWALAGFLIYFPTYANLTLGQVSGWLLLLTAGAWLASRAKQEKYAGILLGLALSVKLFYGLFLIYFLIRKQWRALIYMSVTYMLCTLLALGFFGIRTYQNYLMSLKNIMWYAGTWNASVYGFLSRVFSGGHEGNVPVINIPGVTSILYYLIALMLVIYFVWVVLQNNRKFNESGKINQNNAINIIDWEFSLTIVLMMLISPLSWIYYFTLLIIPFITILRLSNPIKNFNAHFLLLIGIMLLSSIPSNYRLPLELINNKMVFTWASYYFYALVLLFLALVFIRMAIIHRDPIENCDISHQKLSLNIQVILYFLATLPSLISFFIAMI